MESFVEHITKASMVFSDQGLSEMREATLPVVIRNPSPDSPIVDFELRPIWATRAIYSHRFEPGMEQAKLMFSQKTRRLFGSSKAPALLFTMEVDVPSVIQLENLGPIPFLVRVVSELEQV